MPAPRPCDVIDRVDDSNVVIGVVPRAEALTSGVGFRTAHVLVRNHGGDLLLQQIGDDGTRHPGRWGASAAGYLHAGEAPDEGAARRLGEEIGLWTQLDFAGCVHMRDEDSSKFVYVYVTVADEAEIREPGHVAQLRFWGLDRIHDQLAEDADVFTETFPRVLETIEH